MLHSCILIYGHRKGLNRDNWPKIEEHFYQFSLRSDKVENGPSQLLATLGVNEMSSLFQLYFSKHHLRIAKLRPPAFRPRSTRQIFMVQVDVAIEAWNQMNHHQKC